MLFTRVWGGGRTECRVHQHHWQGIDWVNLLPNLSSNNILVAFVVRKACVLVNPDVSRIPTHRVQMLAVTSMFFLVGL